MKHKYINSISIIILVLSLGCVSQINAVIRGSLTSGTTNTMMNPADNPSLFEANLKGLRVQIKHLGLTNSPLGKELLAGLDVIPTQNLSWEANDNLGSLATLVRGAANQLNTSSNRTAYFRSDNPIIRLLKYAVGKMAPEFALKQGWDLAPPLGTKTTERLSDMVANTLIPDQITRIQDQLKQAPYADTKVATEINDVISLLKKIPNNVNSTIMETAIKSNKGYGGLVLTSKLSELEGMVKANNVESLTSGTKTWINSLQKDLPNMARSMEAIAPENSDHTAIVPAAGSTAAGIGETPGENAAENPENNVSSGDSSDSGDDIIQEAEG